MRLDLETLNCISLPVLYSNTLFIRAGVHVSWREVGTDSLIFMWATDADGHHVDFFIWSILKWSASASKHTTEVPLMSVDPFLVFVK